MWRVPDILVGDQPRRANRVNETIRRSSVDELIAVAPNDQRRSVEAHELARIVVVEKRTEGLAPYTCGDFEALGDHRFHEGLVDGPCERSRCEVAHESRIDRVGEGSETTP